MIIKAEIIAQPYSGKYVERIYDIKNQWNSSEWTWIKFLSDDLVEWCGEFRGLPGNVVISKRYKDLTYEGSRNGDFIYQVLFTGCSVSNVT